MLLELAMPLGTGWARLANKRRHAEASTLSIRSTEPWRGWSWKMRIVFSGFMHVPRWEYVSEECFWPYGYSKVCRRCRRRLIKQRLLQELSYNPCGVLAYHKQDWEVACIHPFLEAHVLLIAIKLRVPWKSPCRPCRYMVCIHTTMHT